VLTTSKLNRLIAEVAARIGAGEIGTRELADGSIPLDKLDADIQAQIGVADGAISTAKLAVNALSADGPGRAKMGALFVTEAKLADGAVGEDALGAGAVTAGKMASGIGIGNAAMGTVTSVVTLASNAWANITGLAATITPSSTRSKILVMVHVVAANISSGVGSIGVNLRITRNGTALSVGDSSGSKTRAMGVASALNDTNTSTGVDGDLVFLDSPGSSSALTYQVQAYGYHPTSGSVGINRSYSDSDADKYVRGACSIVVMELLA
jgi:hypothetical protein